MICIFDGTVRRLQIAPIFNFKLLLRSTDAAAWQVVVGWIRRRSPWLQNGIFYRWWDNLSLTLNIQGWLYPQKRSPDR